MDRLQQVAAVASVIPNGCFATRINAKIPADISAADPLFVEATRIAVEAVEAEGYWMIEQFKKQSDLTVNPPPRVLKIKSSPKGKREAVASAGGIRYSFGPVWNDSVRATKGIALAPTNREKLNHQALMLGIDTPELLEPAALCAQIVARL
jgi:hypothetical protein